MTGKKIKIALCLSGEPRSSMFCFPYIYETFLKPNDFFETDVYLYSFKGFRAVPLYNPKDIIINNDNETEIFKSWFNQKNQFDKEVRDKFKNSTDPVSLHSDPLKNLFLMFYGINNCMNLIKTPSKYKSYVFTVHTPVATFTAAM